MTRQFKTIYASSKEGLLNKLRHDYPGWIEHKAPEMWFYGLKWKMIIKKEHPNG